METSTDSQNLYEFDLKLTKTKSLELFPFPYTFQDVVFAITVRFG